jgi:hypothetical protein
LTQSLRPDGTRPQDQDKTSEKNSEKIGSKAVSNRIELNH